MDAPALIGIAGEIMNILIYFAILVHFIAAKGDIARVKFIIVVIGFFTILHFFPENFFYAQAAVALWILFSGFKLLVHSEIMIGLLVLLLILTHFSPVFYIISFFIYLIIVGGFIYSALKMIKL
ncbi:MAG: hypothetical protein ABID38_02100 [Candidatus Diapherotrites archaeon]